MKKTTTILLIAILLILIWTALDDITTGNEEKYISEYLAILLSFSIFGYLMGKFWSKAAFKTQKAPTKRVGFIGNYHIHHSLGGLIILLLGLFLKILWLKIIFIGLGIGIFLEHVYTEGVVFITKEKV